MTENRVNIKSIEQGRAEQAYNFVFEITEKEKESLKKKYKSYVKKLPALIQTNGLAQSMAFIKKRGEGWDELYDHIDGWIKDKNLISKETDILDQVIKLPSDEYRQLTYECLAILNWMRRFVDSLMKDVKENEG